MKIGIDARFYGPTGKGIGRYTQELIKNLEETRQNFDSQNLGGQQDDYFIFLRQDNFDLYQPQNPRFHKVLADYPWYSWQEQILFPKQLASQRLDLVHFLHFNVPLFYFGRFVVTIHDLTLLQYPTQHKNSLAKFMYSFKHGFFILILKNALRRAEKIITDSEKSKQDLIKNFHIKSEKIKVVYLAC